MSSTASAYRDRASERPQDAQDTSQLSSGEIKGWYHATVKAESASIVGGGNTGLNSFPGKLYRMLSNPDYSDVVRWMDHGRAWKVLQPKVFESEVLPKYSNISKYPNFVRQVNAWGFCRIFYGRDKDCYFHEMFLRSRPHLVVRMKKPKGKQKKQNPADVPDFYALPWLPENERDEVKPPSPLVGAGSGSAAAPVATFGADLSASGGGGSSGQILPTLAGVVDHAAIARNAAAAWGGIRQMLSTTTGHQSQQEMQVPQPGAAPSPTHLQQQMQVPQLGAAPSLTHGVPATMQDPQLSNALPIIASGSDSAQLTQEQLDTFTRQNAELMEDISQRERQTSSISGYGSESATESSSPQGRSLPVGTLQYLPEGNVTENEGNSKRGSSAPGGSDSPQLTQEQLDMFTRQNTELMEELSQREREASSTSGYGSESTNESSSPLLPSPTMQGRSLQVGTLQHVPEGNATENDEGNRKPGSSAPEGSDELADGTRGDQTEDEDPLLSFMNWFSSDDVGGKAEDSEKTTVPAVSLLERAKPPYEWMPVMNEYVTIASDGGGAFMLPGFAEFFGYDSVGKAMVWAGLLSHTMVLFFTDTGPVTRGSRWTPINPLTHLCFDICLLLGEVAFMIAMHQHFGPTPYRAAMFLLCCGGLDIWVGANTLFYKIETNPEQFLMYAHKEEEGKSASVKREKISGGSMKGGSKKNGRRTKLEKID